MADTDPQASEEMLVVTDTEELTVTDTDDGGHNELEDEVEWEVFPGQPKPTAVTDALAEKLCVRNLAFRSGKAWTAAGANRSRNREAALAYCVGEIADEPCGKCAAGEGPWTSCVIVKDFLGGACAGCHWGSGGKACSFHSKYSGYPFPFSSSVNLLNRL
jgi:hypothetical protein